MTLSKPLIASVIIFSASNTLQVTAEEFAQRLGESKPSALVDLLEVIFLGFDKNAVVQKALYTASTPEISAVSQALKVCLRSTLLIVLEPIRRLI